MDALFHLRDMIASLDGPLVAAWVTRARWLRNEAIYAAHQQAPADGAWLAREYAQSRTLAGRVQLLRAPYLGAVIPRLCAPGQAPAEREACLAADITCLNAMARRLALSVHVATRKRQALPPALQNAIATGDPEAVEHAITNAAVEADVLTRVAAHARQAAAGPDTVRVITQLYADWLLPLSRKIQVYDLLAPAE